MLLINKTLFQSKNKKMMDDNFAPANKPKHTRVINLPNKHKINKADGERVKNTQK